MNEAKYQTKRKYTEKYPSEHGYANIKFRNKVLEFINSKEKVNKQELSEFFQALEEEVGKKPSRSYLYNNSHLIKKIKENGNLYFKLTSKGKRVLERFNKINEDVVDSMGTYATLGNTVGAGSINPASTDGFYTGQTGSGDRFDMGFKKKKKIVIDDDGNVDFEDEEKAEKKEKKKLKHLRTYEQFLNEAQTEWSIEDVLITFDNLTPDQAVKDLWKPLGKPYTLYNDILPTNGFKKEYKNYEDIVDYLENTMNQDAAENLYTIIDNAFKMNEKVILNFMKKYADIQYIRKVK